MLELRIEVEELVGGLLGLLEELVVGEAGKFEVGKAVLGETENFARATEFEVNFGEFEAGIMSGEGLESAGFGFVVG